MDCNDFDENKLENYISIAKKTTKYGIVLKKGTENEWDAGCVESPVIWFDEIKKMYGMVYVGYDKTNTIPKVGLAWSNNLFVWEKDKINPIYSSLNNNNILGCTAPYIYYNSTDKVYYLYYISLTTYGYEGGDKSMNLAISYDLYKWFNYGKNPIIKPEGWGWRSISIWHPNIIKKNDLYYMFFNASGIVNNKDEERIGYATSLDLINWNVDDNNSPLLSGSGITGMWDSSGRAGDPSVYKMGDYYFMAYYSCNADFTAAYDGLAYTTKDKFPFGWQPIDDNPILSPSSGNSYDSKYSCKPFIINTMEYHFHFYTAVDKNNKREIALGFSEIK